MTDTPNIIMTDKPTHDKWVGAVLGFFLTGSAHYLSGRRRAGLLWFFGMLTMPGMALALLFVSGTVSYIISLAMLLLSGILWLLMLKQSYTPVTDRLADTAATYRVGSRACELPFPARPRQKPGQHIAAGETLWSGVATCGDLLLVDRLSYRFGNPQRGDLLVFKTHHR
jgi:hypothetical protein